MAGIGFSLRKMIKDDSTYSTRVHAWFHTAIVSAGPWIISIITINLILAFSKRWNLPFVERELLISAIIYSTLFSQILTAPFQMVVTRYIADRIYKEEYEYIKPSFWGASAMISLLSLGLGVWFYRKSELPIEFLYLCIALMVVLAVLWVLIVYQSTLKNFKLVTMSNILGTFVTFSLILFLANNPLSFSEFSGATNLLLAYLGGIVFFTLFLLVAFLSEMKEDNGKMFHYIRYFHSEPSLWPIGLVYSIAIWIDNIIMWFSPISVQLFGLFRYAPHYDVATFYSYLTILPSTMLFMVLIETDFYIKCREFFLSVLRNGPYSELKMFSDRMWQSLQRNILQTFEIQLFITIIIIILSKSIFPILNVPESSRQIFVIYSLGAFCNSFILIFMQVLLYIGERNKTLVLVSVFLLTNVLFTVMAIIWGESFYGFGFFLSSFITMLLGLYMMVQGYRRVIQHTYMTQPVYTRTKNRPFERLEEWIDKRLTDQDALDRLVLEKRRDKAIEDGEEIDESAELESLFGVQDVESLESEKDAVLLSDLFANGKYIPPKPEAEVVEETVASSNEKPQAADEIENAHEEELSDLFSTKLKEETPEEDKGPFAEAEPGISEEIITPLDLIDSGEMDEEEINLLKVIEEDVGISEEPELEESVSPLDIIEPVESGKNAVRESTKKGKESAVDDILKIIEEEKDEPQPDGITPFDSTTEEKIATPLDIIDMEPESKKATVKKHTRKPVKNVFEPLDDDILKIITEEAVTSQGPEPRDEEPAAAQDEAASLEMLMRSYDEAPIDVPDEFLGYVDHGIEIVLEDDIRADEFIKTYTGIVLDAEDETDDSLSLQEIVSSYLDKEKE